MAKLRGALVGFGFILSRGHLPAYRRRQARQELEIVAVADVCPARRVLAKDLLPSARVYGDYEELLHHEGDRLDFVDVGTPPAVHASIALAALERSINVLCEKPLCVSPADGLSLLRAAQQRQAVLFPCHNFKHAPMAKAIAREISLGRLGAVTGLTMSMLSNSHAKGVADWEQNWRRNRLRSGGGIAMDTGIHALYLAIDWFSEYPEAVTAKTLNRSGSRWDTEDNLSAVVTFPSGLASLHLSWTAGVRKTICTIHGELGGITVVDDAWERALIQPEAGTNGTHGRIAWKEDCKRIDSGWLDASRVQWFEPVLDEFFTAIDGHQFVPSDTLDAYCCSEVIAAAYKSAAEDCKEVPVTYCEEWT